VRYSKAITEVGGWSLICFRSWFTINAALGEEGSLAVDSAERVLVDRLTRDLGEAVIRNGDCERQAVINEPELEKGRRAEPLSMELITGKHLQFNFCLV
jgi:hypothetical protein